MHQLVYKQNCDTRIMLRVTQIRTQKHFCAVFIVFILLTVACISSVHTQNGLLIFLLEKKWLRERATMLRYTYIANRVSFRMLTSSLLFHFCSIAAGVSIGYQDLCL